MTKSKILLYMSALAVLASCSSRTGELSDSQQMRDGITLIRSVEVVPQKGEMAIVIRSSNDPKYNVFKLTDPERIMIDLIDAEVSESMAKTIEGAGPIASILVNPIQDSLSTLVRLEVRLAQSANYVAGIEREGLTVRVLGGAAMDDPYSDEPLSGGMFGEDDLYALDDLEGFDEIPELPEPVLSELPSFEMPERGDEMDSSAELDLPSFELEPEAPVAAAPPASEPPVLAPLPVPAPLPMEDDFMAEAPELAPSAEALPLPAEERQEEARVIVEPDPELPVAPILTQDIPSSVFTDGASLLSGMGGKVYTGRRVSLEFQDAQIQDVLRLIADVSKLNVVISDDVRGTITLKLTDVPWDQALDIVLTSKGLDKVQHGNILRVAPIEKLKQEREIALANDKAARQLEPLRLKLFNINYAKANEMSDRIKALLSERGNADTDSRTNTLIVEDIAENLSRIENLIAVLDTQTPQVRIESRIVQANDRFTRSLGIQWGPSLKLDGDNNKQTDWQFPSTINVLTAPAGVAGFAGPAPGQLTEFAVDALPGNEVTGGSLGFRVGSVSNIFNLDLRLSYAENEQMARVVSRPSVTVLDNKTARIIQGSRIPFLSSGADGTNVQFQEAGIEISVTPQITNDGAVILTIATRSNEPGSENVGGNPIINIREAQTDMLVRSGRTAVLGGVFKTSETRGRGGVPGLMHIPVLGWLFKGESNSTNREEMLIFITPHILSDSREAQVAPTSSSFLNP